MDMLYECRKVLTDNVMGRKTFEQHSFFESRLLRGENPDEARTSCVNIRIGDTTETLWLCSVVFTPGLETSVLGMPLLVKDIVSHGFCNVASNRLI